MYHRAKKNLLDRMFMNSVFKRISLQLWLATTLTTTLALAAMLSAGTAHAQPELTPAQVQQLQSLSAEEQAALQAQLGGAVGERQSQIPEAIGVTPAAAVAAPQAEAAIEEDAQERQQQDDIATDQVAQTTTTTTLRQFGYELFAGSPSTFAPATNIPVPATYVMGPGDTVIIQLYGQRNITHELVITREGMLMFPEIGPVSVAGLNFQELRDQIQNIVANQLIGQNANVTLGALRSINVFVLGEAAQPGSFTVSSLSTMTNALFASGGVTRIGSLRSIRLMRNGEQVTELDLYDLLLRGDTSSDARLLPGDVIFIPPIGKTVGISGEVRRPAIYELKDETNPADILSLSGGLNPTAFPRSSRIERINDNGERIIVNVDLSPGSAPDPVLNDGDVIQVYSVLDQLENVVMLEGHVHRPGSFQWRDGLRISGVLSSVEEMLPNPDLEYALIARETRPTRRIELLYVNLGAAIGNPGSTSDLLLQPRDQLLTFGASQSRQDQVAGLLSRLRTQASFENPPLIVTVSGNVRFPGEYPLVRDMTMDDVIRFAGGLGTNTDLDYVLLERQTDRSGTIAVQATALNSDTLKTLSPIALQELDRVMVFNVNSSRDELLSSTLQRLQRQTAFRRAPEIVSIAGNVRFPGSYPLHPSADLAGLLQASGNFAQQTDINYMLLEREINELGEISVLKVDLDPQTLLPLTPLQLQPRDRLLVFGANNARSDLLASTLDRLQSQTAFRRAPEIITIEGNVRFPGSYPLHQNAELADLLQAAGRLTEETNLEYVLLEREVSEFGDIDVLKIDLNPQTLQPLTPLQLQPRDRLLVFGANSARDGLLESTLGKLRNQANSDSPTRIVSVRGNVRFPGNYPLYRDLSVGGLVQIAGGFVESADITTAEVTRYDAEPQVGRIIDHVTIGLTDPSPGTGMGLSLTPFDQLTIRQMPNWTGTETVSLDGEVRAPGVYTITKEDTLSSLIQRAGGLTEFADPRAAIFLREQLRANEQRMLDEFRERLQRDLVMRNLQGSTEETALQTGDVPQMLALLESTEAIGRLAINLPVALSGEGRSSDYDVILRDGDRLLIPRTQQEISVIGEVNRPTSHLYRRGESVSDYIGRSGGYTPNADHDNVFVIQANGEVISYSGSHWFFQQGARLEAGDSIVVPFNARQTNYLVVWRSISQILFNLSTTLLAIERVGN
jgi:polysaccharide export outer membrane protein